MREKLNVLAHMLSCFAMWWNYQEPAPPNPYPVSVTEIRVVSVVDGDTYWAEPVASRFQIRLINADTWESRRVRRTGSGPISDAEIAKGKAAKEAVEQLLADGAVYVETKPTRNLEPIRRDTFGRVLGTVKVHRFDTGETVDVGEWLKKNGHTRD